MKLILNLLLIVSLFPSISHAIERLPGQWSLKGSGGYFFHFEEDFNATWEEMSNSFRSDDLKIPFNKGYPFYMSGILEYNFPESNLSVNTEFKLKYIRAENTDESSPYTGDRASYINMNLLFGAAYRFKSTEEGFVPYVGAGIGYGSYYISTDSRFIIRFETGRHSLIYDDSYLVYGFSYNIYPGIRYSFEKLPISLEFTSSLHGPIYYSAVEGKEYEKELFDDFNLINLDLSFGIRLWM